MAGILWNYLLGYVIIDVKGRGLERFLNYAVHSGLELWEIKRTGADSICAHISMADFYSLRRLMREQGGLTVSIIGKHGLPLTIAALRARKVLLVGWVIVLGLVIAASRCVWLVSIDGCDMVDEQQVHDMINAMGVEAGIPRREIRPNELAGELMADDPLIAWAGVSLQGVIMHVSILEAQEVTLPDEEPPSSIYASRDGVIVDIVALNGRAAVVKGDVVQKGDLLIDAYMGTVDSPTVPVAAEGSVTARVTYVLVGEQTDTAVLETRTGASATGVRLSMLGFCIEDDAVYPVEPEITDACLMQNCFLPLRAEALTWHETAPARRTLSYFEQRELALAAAEARIADIPTTDTVMISKTTRIERLESGAVRAIITIITEEDICERRIVDTG